MAHKFNQFAHFAAGIVDHEKRMRGIGHHIYEVSDAATSRESFWYFINMAIATTSTPLLTDQREPV